MKKLPQEIATWYVIPAVKKEFVKEMLSRGLSQRKAAEKLGLTEAAVSQYLSQKRAAEVKLDKKIVEMIRESVTNILDKGSDVFTEIYKIVQESEKADTICKIHMMYEEVPQGCDVCFAKKEQVLVEIGSQKIKHG